MLPVNSEHTQLMSSTLAASCHHSQAQMNQECVYLQRSLVPTYISQHTEPVILCSFQNQGNCRKNVHSPNSRWLPCTELQQLKNIYHQQHHNFHIQAPKGTDCTARSTQADRDANSQSSGSMIQDPEYYKDIEACWDLAISLRTAPTTAACSRHSDLFKASNRLTHVVTLTLYPLKRASSNT